VQNKVPYQATSWLLLSYADSQICNGTPLSRTIRIGSSRAANWNFFSSSPKDSSIENFLSHKAKQHFLGNTSYKVQVQSQ
jgi:hypothetical protein